MPSDKRFDPEEMSQLLKQFGKGVKLKVFQDADQLETDEGEPQDDRRDKALEFNFKPSEIKEYLDRFVIQQDDAKKVLATAVCDHYHHIRTSAAAEPFEEYKKQNIILIGATGVGKTYLVQNIARLIGVPFVKADATRFSETGYVGGDVEDLVRDLVLQAEGDIELAEYGIIYLDEIDKIAGAATPGGRDVSGHGVQRGLLKLMEDTDVPQRSATDIAGQMQALMELQTQGRLDKKTISTKHILFIVSGAFDGMTDIIRKRLGSKKIGFREGSGLREGEHEIYKHIRSVDFIEYGFEAEFIGRLPVMVHCNPLAADDLFKILKFSEGSLLRQYKRDFLAYGIDTYFTDPGMRAFAEAAVEEKTGARGLMTVCEKVFREFKYQLPDHPEVQEFVVEADLIQDPGAKLEELLADPTMHRDRVVEFQIGKFEQTFLDEFGLRVKMTGEAVALMNEKGRQGATDGIRYCLDLFREHQHALNLLRNSGLKKELSLDVQALEDPSGALEGWIRDTYQRSDAHPSRGVEETDGE